MRDDPGRTTFEQALAEHRRFVQLSQELRNFLEHPRPEIGSGDEGRWATALCHHVVSLHESVNKHFLVEEVGLLRDIRSRFPAAQPRLDESQREHTEILTGIKEIVADAMTYAEAVPPDDPKLRQRTTGLLEQIASHEEKVTDLVQDLALTDIGTGD